MTREGEQKKKKKMSIQTGMNVRAAEYVNMCRLALCCADRPIVPRYFHHIHTLHDFYVPWLGKSSSMLSYNVY